jgi:hypothetical protein
MEKLKDEELYQIEGGNFADFCGGLLFGLVVMFGL